jgi:hypothetical protein
MLSLRALYHALHGNAGRAVCHDVLAPWIDDSAVAAREMLAPMGAYG